MAAGIEEHTGKTAGRVTIITTLTSLIPPVAVSGVLILCAVLDIISDEVAGVAILTALGLGAATTGTVFGTAKNTKTDQADVIWGSAPVADVVTPVATGEVVSKEVLASEEDDAPIPAGRHSATLADELAQIRPVGVL